MAQSELPEVAEMRQRLENVRRNASFVESTDVLSAVLGCNPAPYFVGGGEAAKSAMFYTIKCATNEESSEQVRRVLRADDW